jgi:hypothetical protein
MEVRLRLIYPDHLPKETIGAASRGLSRLGEFGAVCEQAGLREPLWDVVAGRKIKKIIGSGKPAVVVKYPFEEKLADMAADAGVIGIGITDQPLFIDGERMRMQALEVATKRTGAVVSLAGFDEPATGPAYRSQAPDAGIALKGVELTVARAAGKILSPYSDRLYRGHCHDSSCIMQECKGAADLMEKMMRFRLDICLSCKTDIRGVVRSMQDY